MRKSNPSAGRARYINLLADDSDRTTRALQPWQAYSVLHWPKHRDACMAAYTAKHGARHPPMVYVHEISFRQQWLTKALAKETNEVREEVLAFLEKTEDPDATRDSLDPRTAALHIQR